MKGHFVTDRSVKGRFVGLPKKAKTLECRLFNVELVAPVCRLGIERDGQEIYLYLVSPGKFGIQFTFFLLLFVCVGIFEGKECVGHFFSIIQY